MSKLELLVADMRAASECGNTRVYFERDAALHILLAELSGNRFLVEFLKRLISPLFAFILLQHSSTWDTARRRQVLGEHGLILSALRSGDPEFAVREIVAVMEGSLKAAIAVIEMVAG